jgi:hypothetical protein
MARSKKIIKALKLNKQVEHACKMHETMQRKLDDCLHSMSLNERVEYIKLRDEGDPTLNDEKGSSPT